MAFFGAGIEMRAYLHAVSKNSGGLNHDIDGQLFPRQTGGFSLTEHGDRPAVDFHDAVRAFYLARVNAIGRIVAKQVCIRFQIRHIVDRNDGDFLFAALEQGAQYQPANPAETIDCDFGCHQFSC